jgi:hypothetical protein
MNPATQHDVGSIVAGHSALIPNVVTAGGAGDGTEQDGYWVDRDDRLSGVLIINYSTTLAEGETLTLAANLRDATDSGGTGAADYGDAYAAAVVATGDTGGSTETGVVEIDVDLGAANHYIQGQVTPTLSAASTDTVALSAVFVLSGARKYPI